MNILELIQNRINRGLSTKQKNRLKKRIFSLSIVGAFASKSKSYSLWGVFLFRLSELIFLTVEEDYSVAEELGDSKVFQYGLKEFSRMVFSSFLADLVLWITGVTNPIGMTFGGFAFEFFNQLMSWNVLDDD